MPADDDVRERLARLERRAARERAARQEAEQLLESKSRELYLANVALQELANSLERRVDERSQQIREMEAQLRQSHKMEAVGLLAGGIAHDFNNLLMIVGGAVELLDEETDPDTITRILADLRAAVKRGRDLTSGLLAFSRQEAFDTEDVDPARAVRGLEHLLRRLLTERINLRFDLADSLLVRMNRGGFDQILLNLASNARDAMPRGGDFTIRALPCTVEPHQASTLHLDPGMYLRLEVGDTGTGMSSETIGRAFDPFFTTKPLGKGNGLGLANVYAIVKQSNGHISVESTEGSGTTFRILLPCRRAAASAEAPPSTPSLPPATTSHTVLVVDDDDGVRRVTASLLRRHGLIVLEASSGTDALALLEDPTFPIGMLILDVRMPGMNGFDLAQAAREHRPDIPLLLVSGYVDDPEIVDAIMSAGLKLMEKPYAPHALLSFVEQSLAQAPSVVQRAEQAPPPINYESDT